MVTQRLMSDNHPTVFSEVLRWRDASHMPLRSTGFLDSVRSSSFEERGFPKGSPIQKFLEDKKPGTVPARWGFFVSPPQRGKRQEIRDSPRAIRSSIRRTVTGFFPTVAWPSEAVRVRDESIALTRKQVGAPLYGPTRCCWFDQSPDGASWRAWEKRGDSPNVFFDGN